MNVVTYELDPTKDFTNKGVAQDKLIMALGYLPEFIQKAADESEPIIDGMANNYAFFTGWTKKSSKWDVDENGVYEYKGDPKLYPILKATLNDETIYILQYGMVVAVEADGTKKYTRMD